jgi:hypothetical protein
MGRNNREIGYVCKVLFKCPEHAINVPILVSVEHIWQYGDWGVLVEVPFQRVVSRTLMKDYISLD